MWTPNAYPGCYGASHQQRAPEPDYKALSDYYASQLSVSQAEVTRLVQDNQSLYQSNQGLHRENASLTTSANKERENYKKAVKQNISDAANARNTEAALRAQIMALQVESRNYKLQLENEKGRTAKAKEDLGKAVSKLAKAEIKEVSLRKHRNDCETQVKKLKSQLQLQTSKEPSGAGLDNCGAKLAKDFSSQMGLEDADQAAEKFPTRPDEYDTDVETRPQPTGPPLVRRKFQGPTRGTLLAISEALETEAKAHKLTKEKLEEAESTIELQKIPVAHSAIMRLRFIYQQSDLPMDDKAWNAIEEGNSGGHDGKWDVDIALCKLGFFGEDVMAALEQIYKNNVKKCVESVDNLKFHLNNPTWTKILDLKASMRLLLDYQPHGDASIRFTELKNDCNLIFGDLRQAYSTPEDALEAFEKSEVVKSKVEQMALIVKDRLQYEGKLRRRRYRAQ
ncbi:hypothetical protein BDZ45DRAFT_132281 [Acephala macrosclerotiorum]|nr:hypothetical protein BDZ45DRAFT_132281 [Acephala macrosclerotiorum]